MSNIEKLQQDIKNFLAERGWTSMVPADIAKSVIIEAAELLEIFQWSNPDLKDIEKDPEKFSSLKKEIADIFIYLFNFSVMFNLDTEKIIREKLEYNRKKFPVNLVKGNNQKYLDIKAEYRKKGLK